jgi:hypothetical protein
MVFDKGGITERIWEKFISNKNKWMMKFRSDQDFLQGFFPDLDTFPVKWITKLGRCIEKDGNVRFSKNAKIILCMPQKNNFAVNRFDIVKEIWQ